MLQRWAVRLTALAMLCSFATFAKAQTTIEYLREDFSNGDPGWSQQGYLGDNGLGWYWIQEGAGDYNGSLKQDLWMWSEAEVFTPAVDVSALANDADEVVVEFDAWIEQNQYARDDKAFDHLVVKVGKTQLIDLNTNNDYTYYNENYYSGETTTNEKDWRHYKIKIPTSERTSDMQISFSTYWENGESLSDPAIDNVVITGTHYTTYSYAPTTLNFGEVAVGESAATQFVTLSNSNDFDVKMSSYSIDGPASSYFEIVTAPDAIPAGTVDNPGTATIEVRYNALQFGNHVAELSFYGEVDKEQIGRVTLKGSGVSPAISVGDVKTLFLKRRTQLGATRDTFVVVTHSSNTGTLRISPDTYISGEYSDQYSIIRLPKYGLLPGQSDTIWVRHNPTIEGARSATLNIISNGGNGTQMVDLRGTGILQRFTITPSSFQFDSTEMLTKTCQVFTISNPGSDTLRVKDIYFAYADPDFTFQSLDGNQMTIAPEHSREISVCFEPLSMGYRQARLRIITDIPKTFEGTPRDTSEFTVDLSGVGVPFGELTYGDYETDSSIVGQEQCQTDTLWNVGDYAITVTAASIVGANASEFELKNVTFPIIIPAGSFTTVTMCATPGARGQRDAQIIFYASSNSKLDTITLPRSTYGQIVCAEPSMTSLFDAGMTLVHAMDSMKVTITNCGDIPATYTAALPLGTTDYQIIGSPVSTVVAPGGTYDYWVRFTPNTRGAVTSTLSITSPSVSTMNIALNGTGASVTAATNNFTVPETAVTQSNTFTVTVTNNGNIDWTTGTPLVSGAAYSTTSTGLTLAPGASGDITFTFAPTVVGVNTGSVTFPNASPLEEPALTTNFSGMGVTSSVRTTAMNGFALEQNYPNPALSSTSVRFTTPSSAMVTISLVDMTGQTVRTLTSVNYPMGTHTVELDARELSAGTYFYVLTSEGVQLTRQLTVIK